MWRFRPGMFWAAHAPPALVERVVERGPRHRHVAAASPSSAAPSAASRTRAAESRAESGAWRVLRGDACLPSSTTSAHGLVFSHHAYVSARQVSHRHVTAASLISPGFAPRARQVAFKEQPPRHRRVTDLA